MSIRNSPISQVDIENEMLRLIDMLEEETEAFGRLAEDAAKKALGQNFLFDLNLTRRIARAAGPLEGFTVIEIGPGPGGLTRGLLAEGARKVLAIEKDARCLPALAEIAAAYPGRLEVIEGDEQPFEDVCAFLSFF